MNIDQKCIEWLEKEINNMDYGEVGIVFKIHQGHIVGHRKIVEKKEHINLDKQKEAL